MIYFALPALYTLHLTFAKSHVMISEYLCEMPMFIAGFPVPVNNKEIWWHKTAQSQDFIVSHDGLNPSWEALNTMKYHLVYIR